MQLIHEKHCGGSLAAGGAKPPLSLSMYIERLPHPFWRQHIPIASMRSFVIVEVYDGSYQSSCFFKIMRTFHLIKPFLLDDAVHTFCYGIICRLIVLRHADGGIDSLQMFYIQVTAVLYTTVGMMNQSLKSYI